ncbi:hypothetical protein Pmani_003543 [Petrolisthes manimaculis]|uniref:LanC-like protein 2 n=1 Tax=Petrolisthes manimaculis TaxID=1843537 RepID=A0AAE1QGJ1_9EUCA|nr:hypothetical protein Pmani_003543 [Petrolisthes manimaculis]
MFPGFLRRSGPDRSAVLNAQSFKNPYPKEIRDDRTQVMDPQQRMLSATYRYKLDETIKKLVSKWESGKNQGAKKEDVSIYSGTTGHALLYFRLFQQYKEQSYLSKGYDLLNEDLRKLKKKGKHSSFLMGDSGTLALGAWYYNKTGVEDKCAMCVKELLQLSKYIIPLNTSVKDEVLDGKAGYLYSLLFLRSKGVRNDLVTSDAVRQVVKAILDSGQQTAMKERSPTPLLYLWHGKAYIGAARGLVGVLFMLLQAREFLEMNELHGVVRQAVDFVCGLQLLNGNIPFTLESPSEFQVHWNHGAPGAIFLFGKAYQVFGDAKYMQHAYMAGDCVWERGLARDGYGLANGTAGNGYALLYLYQVTGRPEFLYRAGQFGCWVKDYDTHCCKPSEHPYSIEWDQCQLLLITRVIISAATSRWQLLHAGIEAHSAWSGMASGGGDRLRVVTAVNLRQKMDALVSDLSHALDESQLPQYHRKRRGFKRRAKLATNLGLSGNRGVLSEDSSSSIGEVLLSQDNKSSIPLTDSDDLSPPSESRHRTQLLTHHHHHHRASSNLVESDSVNENFSPARPHNRRRRKCKRLALDPDIPSASTSTTTTTTVPTAPPPTAALLSPPAIAKPTTLAPSSSTSLLPGATRKKKVLRQSPETENRYLAISAGKRKRGRERSAEWCASGGHVSHHHHHGHHHHHHHHRRYGSSSSSSHLHHHSNLRVHRSSQASTEDSMEYDYSDDANMEHSTSESSSESETGIYTCDEGREADDEQSDWFAEPDPVYGVPGASNVARQRTPTARLSWWNDNDLGLSSSAKALFKERYETMSVENQQACRLRFQKLRERLLRREIRAGRRRLRDRKPGFSIVSSVNEKVSRFLQDPRQSELRLRPMTDKDRDQLRHLANLYSLSIHSTDDHNAPILTKTRNTITKQRLEVDEAVSCNLSFPGGLPVPLSDLKRRRRTPPPPPSNLTEGSNDSVESITNSANLPGGGFRPPVPSVSWEDDGGDCCADSLSERLADSEPDPLPSPTSLGLHDCTL